MLPADTPVIMILAGIGGSRNDAYVKRFAAQCASFGWRPVSYSYWRLDWNDWRDMHFAVEAVSNRYPRAPIFAVGFSAGGYVVANYLASVGEHTPLVAAVIIAGCFDFVRTYDYCDEQPHKIYTSLLDRSMKRCVLRHLRHDEKLFSADAARSAGRSDGRLSLHHRPQQQVRRAHGYADGGGVLARSYEALLAQVTRANILYDRHLALLPRFSGCPEDRGYARPNTGSLRWLGSTSREPPSRLAQARRAAAARAAAESAMGRSAIDATDRRDDRWWGALSDQYACEYPLGATALHTNSPVRGRVEKIAVTTLVIHARDDPIVSHDDTIDWSRMRRNRNVISVRTDRGGHLGWHEGLLPFGATWADKRACDFVHAVLGMRAQTQFFVDVVRRAARSSRAAPQRGAAALYERGVGVATPPASPQPAAAEAAPGADGGPSGQSLGGLEEPVPRAAFERSMRESANLGPGGEGEGGEGPGGGGEEGEEVIPPGVMARLCSISSVEMPPEQAEETAAANAVDTIKTMVRRGFEGGEEETLGRYRRASFGATVEAAITGGAPGNNDYSASISGLNLPHFFANAAGSALAPEDLRAAPYPSTSGEYEREEGAPMF